MMAVTRPYYLLLFLLVLPMLWAHRHTFTALSPVRHRLALWLRTVIMILLILAAAGVRWNQPRTEVCTIFLIDVSHSVDPQAVAAAEEAVARAARDLPPGNLYGVILFGREGAVLKPPGRAMVAADRRQLNPEGTDLAGALRLAASLVPRGFGPRLVLLTDGRETEGDALAAADELAAAGVELDLHPLVGRAGDRVALTDLEMPRQARVDQPDQARLIIAADKPESVSVSVTRDDKLLTVYAYSHPGGGERSVVVPVIETEPGFHRYAYQAVVAGDPLPQNNRQEGFISVAGPPSVLLIADNPGEVAGVQSALAAAQFKVETRPSGALPPVLRELRAFDAVVLANVPATALGSRNMANLKNYVNDAGGGLAMLGGPLSFGPGGYYRTPVEDVLPVTMDLRNRRQMPISALVLAIDKSGSMSMVENGCEKIELAKKGAVLAAELMGMGDYLGVIGFDDATFELVPFEPLTSLEETVRRIGTLAAGGGTNIFPALELARKWLNSIPAMNKHFILLSDGCTAGGDHMGLARAMLAEGITSSSLTIGSDANLVLMEQLANAGGGRFYATTDPADIPRIFTRETMLTVKKAIIEDPFTPVPGRPHDVMRGLEAGALPQLAGYVGCSPKPQADVALLSTQDDPLLATMRSGLGKSLVFTSDATTRWGGQWLAWDGYTRFWEQAARWLLPDAGDLRASCVFALEGNRVRATVEVRDEGGTPVNFLSPLLRCAGNDNNSAAGTLAQTGAGRYEGELVLPARGSYLVSVSDAGAGHEQLILRTGLGYSCAPEYRYVQPGGVLSRLKRYTGVSEVNDLSGSFRPRLAPVYLNHDLWRPLLLLALVLFLFDIAVRRVDFRLVELYRAWQAWRAGAEVAKPDAPQLARVQALRDRLLRVPTRRRGPAAATISPTELTTLGAPGAATMPRDGDAPGVAVIEQDAPAVQRQAVPHPPRPASHTSRLLDAKRKAKGLYDRK